MVKCSDCLYLCIDFDQATYFCDYYKEIIPDEELEEDLDCPRFHTEVKVSYKLYSIKDPCEENG